MTTSSLNPSTYIELLLDPEVDKLGLKATNSVTGEKLIEEFEDTPTPVKKEETLAKLGDVAKLLRRYFSIRGIPITLTVVFHKRQPTSQQ